MPSSLNGGGTGGGATLPATPAAALLDAGSPSTMLGLNSSGVGEALSASAARSRMGLDRRPATSSALLWECSEGASPLASTGSVACSLADAGAAVIGYTDALSPLTGTGLRCTGASGSEVIGGAGVYPASATTTAVTAWALVVIRTMPSVAGAVLARDYATTGGAWSAPYGTLLDVLAGGVVRAFAPFGASPVYDSVSSAAGEVQINRPHLVGFTYNGSTLRVWVDGREVASKSVDTPLTWGTTGSWHLGGNGGGSGNTLDGSVLRAGVQTTVWTQTQWAELYRASVGVPT